MKNTNNKFKTIRKAPICISLEPALIKEVARLAKNLGCSKSKVMEKVLVEYFGTSKEGAKYASLTS